MGDPFAGMKVKSRYDTQPVIQAPVPPPVDESFINMLGRKFKQTANPLFDQADAAVRNAANRASVGIADKLENTFGAPGISDTARHTQDALTKFPEASAGGGAAGTILQSVPISRAIGAAGWLGRPTAGAQAANQALTGAGQSALQQTYEAARDERSIEPGKFIGGTTFGALLGALGGGATGVAGRGTASGITARTLPTGMSAADRTALAKTIQRGDDIGFHPDLAEAARASGRPDLVERVAPAVERQIRRGGETVPGEPLPTHMKAHLAPRQQPGGYFDRKATAQATLAEIEDDIAAARLANVRADRINKAANEPGPRAGPPTRERGKFSRPPAGPVKPSPTTPVPDNAAALSEVEKFKSFMDLERAAAHRPSLPEAPGPVRPPSFSARIPAMLDFTYRGGRHKTGPSAGEAGAAELMQKTPEVAAGLLGRTPFGETVAGSLPSSVLRDPALWLLMQGLGANK